MNVQQKEGQWDPLVWQQCLLGSPLPRKLRKGKKLWTVLRGSVIWIMWIDRNADCFADGKWTSHMRELRIWEAMVDIIRTAWARTRQLISKYLVHRDTFLARFDKQWLPQQCLVERVELKLVWKMQQPKLGDFKA